MSRVKQSGQLESRENTCKPCPVAASTPVCGSDGHNYASEVTENIKHQCIWKDLLRYYFSLAFLNWFLPQ